MTKTIDRSERARREFSRRRFLQGALAAGGAAALDASVLRGVAMAGPALGVRDRIFVLIELSGGNDGLNTLVPVGDGAYYTRRGTATNVRTKCATCVEV